MKVKTTTKTFRNFLVANLCFLLPLWVVAFGWMPDQVKVDARGAEPVALVADGVVLQGEEHGVWKEGTVWRFYLREGMAWKDLAFRLPEGMDGNGVGWVRLEKWKLFSLAKEGAGLERKDGETNVYIFKNPCFARLGIAQGNIPLGLAVVEGFLIGISWWFAKRHLEETWKALCPSVLCVALVLTVLMQVALPVQSWLANRSAYPFGAGALAFAVAWRWTWIFVLVTVALGVLTRCFGRWVLGMALAFTVCVYLETGLLAAGLPDLNGDWGAFHIRKRILWDTVAWGVVFALTVCFHPVLKKRYGLVSMCLLVLIGASMLDTKREEKADTSKLIVDDFVPLETVVRSVTYSTNRNIMVFVIDSLEREHAHAIMEDPEAGPGLKEQFRGFTEFINNVGALPKTLMAVPNMLTGRYPETISGLADYYWSPYGPESVLADFLAAGFGIYMTTHALGCGYATGQRNEAMPSQQNRNFIDCAGLSEDTWSLRKITRFRWMPYAIKASCGDLTEKATISSQAIREWSVYPILASRNTDSAFPIFLWIHTEGTHVPVMFNRNGEMLQGHNDLDADCIEMGVFIMRELGKLFDVYRQNNIYDNSLIVVVGDHGQHSSQEDGAVLPRNAKPCLWIKPVGSKNDFATSEEPTTNARLSALFKKAICEDLNEDDIKKIMTSEKRIYRWRPPLLGEWKDWEVNGDGSFTLKETNPSNQSFSSANALQCNHHYSLIWDKTARNQEDIVFTGVGYGLGPEFFSSDGKMTLYFKLPQKRKRYLLKLDIDLRNYGEIPACMEFRQAEPAGAWIAVEQEKNSVVSLSGLSGDGDGIVKIEGRSCGGDFQLSFNGLMLEEEP